MIDNPALSGFKVAHGLALCSAGAHDKAGALLKAAAADQFASVPRDLSWSTTVALWSEVAFRVGATEAIEPLHELLLPHEHRIIVNGSTIWGPVARDLGRLALMMGRYDEAEAHLNHATAEHERLGTPTPTGCSVSCRCVAPGGDAARGRELLQRAVQTAREHGAAQIEREAEEALAALASAAP